jgi:hypothetical protein
VGVISLNVSLLFCIECIVIRLLQFQVNLTDDFVILLEDMNFTLHLFILPHTPQSRSSEACNYTTLHRASRVIPLGFGSTANPSMLSTGSPSEEATSPSCLSWSSLPSTK